MRVGNPFEQTTALRPMVQRRRNSLYSSHTKTQRAGRSRAKPAITSRHGEETPRSDLKHANGCDSQKERPVCSQPRICLESEAKGGSPLALARRLSDHNPWPGWTPARTRRARDQPHTARWGRYATPIGHARRRWTTQCGRSKRCLTKSASTNPKAARGRPHAPSHPSRRWPKKMTI